MSKPHPDDYILLEKRDEEQIIAEMQGQVLNEYFYEFSAGGRKVTGISWLGIKEIARQYGKIDVTLVELRETDESWIAVMKATDTEKGYGMLGTSVQAKLMSAKGNMIPDPFCVQKVFSKAQRNAIRALIPERMFIEASKTWRKDKGSSSRQTQSRRQAPSDVKVVDFLKPKGITMPNWLPSDELIRSPEMWEQAQNIVETWMEEAGLNLEAFEVKSDNLKVTVKPIKAIPVDQRPEVNGVLIGAGFNVNKQGLFRLNKKDIE